MLPLYTPWFYWNFVGLTRDKLVNVFDANAGFELICDTGKSTIWMREHYPIENPPDAISRITSALMHAGTFDRIEKKILSNKMAKDNSDLESISSK